jgi:hypothetical protein
MEEKEELRKMEDMTRGQRTGAQERNCLRLRDALSEMKTKAEEVDLAYDDKASDRLLRLRRNLGTIREEIAAFSNTPQGLDEDVAYELNQSLEQIEARLKELLDDVGYEDFER